MVITLCIFNLKKVMIVVIATLFLFTIQIYRHTTLEDIYSDVMLKSDSWEFVRHYTIRNNK